MSFLLHQEIINPYGICLGEGLAGEDGFNPYTRLHVTTIQIGNGVPRIRFRFESLRGYGDATHRWDFYLEDFVIDYTRQVYNLSSDVELSVSPGSPLWRQPSSYIGQSTFETQEEALESVDTIETNNPQPSPLFMLRNGDNLFHANWQEQVDGVWIRRTANLNYAGDEVTLYTINDFVNFLALFFEVTPEEVLNKSEYSSDIFSVDEYNPPSFDCEPYKRLRVIDIDGPLGPVEVDIDFDGSSIPGDVTVTVVDGDPDLTLTEIVNGPGSVTIADNGNINMRNDGGTFYLNEFGNVGFFANGDASLTANTQVQLGVGRITLNVDSDGLNMRDSTGTVSFTVDELSRLKNLLGE